MQCRYSQEPYSHWCMVAKEKEVIVGKEESVREMDVYIEMQIVPMNIQAKRRVTQKRIFHSPHHFVTTVVDFPTSSHASIEERQADFNKFRC
jgi:hypothetical protein